MKNEYALCVVAILDARSKMVTEKVFTTECSNYHNFLKNYWFVNMHSKDDYCCVVDVKDLDKNFPANAQCIVGYGNTPAEQNIINYSSYVCCKSCLLYTSDAADE